MGNVTLLSEQFKSRMSGIASDRDQGRSWLRRFDSFTQMEFSLDEKERIFWQKVRPTKRPSLTVELLDELKHTNSIVRQGYEEDIAAGRDPIRYMVLASSLPNIFLLGGDLPMFLERVTDRDATSLRLYAHRCIDVMHEYIYALNLPIHTISLVQGDSLGGGFEGALATDVIIAEKKAKFGLPEILFNLFPGMGAYTLLSRKIGMAQTERMIFSGKIYSAEEMHDMGVVDHVVEDGHGDAAVYDYIERYERTFISRQAVMKARKIAHPVSRDEMIAIVDVWVDSVMALQPGDLRKMQAIAKAQDRRWASEQGGTGTAAAKQGSYKKDQLSAIA